MIDLEAVKKGLSVLDFVANTEDDQGFTEGQRKFLRQLHKPFSDLVTECEERAAIIVSELQKRFAIETKLAEANKEIERLKKELENKNV